MSDSDFEKNLAKFFPPNPPLPPRPPRPSPTNGERASSLPFSNASASFADATAPQPPDSPAHILARLVYFGAAPKPLPSWPPEWQQAYNVVSQVRGSLHDRINAFEDFIATRPNATEMHVRLNEATPARIHRGEKMRSLFAAADSFRHARPLDWVVAGLFARPSVNLLVGDPGSKKTLLALDLSVSVASGTPWLDHPIGISPLTLPDPVSPPLAVGATHASPAIDEGGETPPLPITAGESLLGDSRVNSPTRREATPVLFIDEETGKPRLFSRVRGAMLAHNAPRDIPFHFMSLPGFNLSDETDIEEFKKFAQSVGAGLIIIDALADVLRGHNENTVGSTEPFFNSLRTIAEDLHAAILIIHHNNKSGTIRGSSVFAATVDLLLSIESPPDSDLILLRPLKTREAAPQPITARIHFSGDQFHLTPTDEIPAFALAETTIKQEILAYLVKHGNATTPELMAWLSEYNPGSVRNYVNYLLSTKQIRRVNIDEKGKPALFELAQKGEHNERG